MIQFHSDYKKDDVKLNFKDIDKYGRDKDQE